MKKDAVTHIAILVRYPDVVQQVPSERWRFEVRLNGADHQWGKDPPKEVVG